ncbi:hypothetical protein BH09PLA1_BH09PLA1_29590 [soil metagenome]
MRSISKKLSGSSKRSSNAVEFAALESRLMFCGYHAAAGGAILTQTPGLHAPGNGSSGSDNHGGTRIVTGLNVPVYNSLPGAKATIYLDFDGDDARTWGSYSVPFTPAYDTDGHASGFSAQELANIAEIWQRVAEKFSPFNINVTTVDPGNYANGKAMQVVIGGNGSWMSGGAGGVSYVNSFTNSSPNTAYAFTMNLGNGFPKYVAEAISHESGHSFGLQHQSAYSGQTKTAEYSSGTSSSAPTMGNSYGAARGMWWTGTSSNGTSQDDLAVLSSSTNGFGYRGDDYGSAMSSAKNLKFKSGKFSIKGALTSVSDKDFFKFNFNGGSLTLKLRGQGAGSMLDAKLRLYKSDGTMLNNIDGSGLSETIIRTLPAGTYYAAVFSHGGYGDIGQYTLYGYDDVAGAPAPSTAPSPSTGGSTQGTNKVASIFSSESIAKSLHAELVAELLAA